MVFLEANEQAKVVITSEMIISRALANIVFGKSIVDEELGKFFTNTDENKIRFEIPHDTVFTCKKMDLNPRKESYRESVVIEMQHPRFKALSRYKSKIPKVSIEEKEFLRLIRQLPIEYIEEG